MPPFVYLVVILGGVFAVLAGRDDRGDVVRRQGVSQPIGIERAVGEQVIGGKLFDQVRHAPQIVGLAGQKAEIDEVAKRIRQGQYLGRDAAARPPYGLALSPPLAPWPARWTLTMVPSIIAYSKSTSALKALNIR